MQEADKNRILNFLIGHESIQDFESWVYYNTDLVSRIGKELYFELMNINYKDKKILANLRKVILGNYMPLIDYNYKRILQDSGWHENRRIQVNLSNFPNTPEIKNALKIIKEYGGLKFISPDKIGNWTHTLVEFLETPSSIQNMVQYGLCKNLVCFAMAHNNHTALFVDDANKFYQLDDIISEDLYEYKGLNFEHMMKELLQLEEHDCFEIVGRRT